MKGKIQTVLGPLDPEQLGLTLTHEHLLHDLCKTVFRAPLPFFLRSTKDVSFSMENLGFIRQYPYCYDQNVEFGDESVRSAVHEEMAFFKKNGGGAIVDNCSIGLRAKDHPHYLRELAQSTGLNIVAGTGFYVSCSQSDQNQSVESMSEKIRQDLLSGMNGTDVRCGVIGEVGCSHPLQDFERRSLVSTALVQQEVGGAPVIIHPGRDRQSPEEIFRVFQEAGGDVTRTVMSHLDRTLLTEEDLLEFAGRGSYCEFDLFGLEVSYYQPNQSIAMPSDAQRIDRIRCLLEGGFGDRVLIAHDIHTKHRLMKFGGHGFSHILLNVVPQMTRGGISPLHIHNILYTNPKNWLTYP